MSLGFFHWYYASHNEGASLHPPFKSKMNLICCTSFFNTLLKQPRQDNWSSNIIAVKNDDMYSMNVFKNAYKITQIEKNVQSDISMPLMELKTNAICYKKLITSGKVISVYTCSKKKH